MQSSRDLFLIIALAITLYFSLALFNYSPTDPSWFYSGDSPNADNLTGNIGAGIAAIFLAIIGYAAYLMPVLFCVMIGQFLWLHSNGKSSILGLLSDQILGMFFIILCVSTVFASFITNIGDLPELPGNVGMGGIIGGLLNFFFIQPLGQAGIVILCVTFFVVGISLFARVAWVWLVIKIYNLGVFYTVKLYIFIIKTATIFVRFIRRHKKNRIAKDQVTVVHVESPFATPRAGGNELINESQDSLLEKKPEAITEPQKPQVVKQTKNPKSDLEANKKDSRHDSEGNTDISLMPELSLLDAVIPKEQAGIEQEEEIAEMALNLEIKFKDFGVEAKVVDALLGPVVTRFEIQPAAGVKAAKITALGKDLARSLAVSSVRVVEIIPGKTVVGIEIPNKKREIVRLSEILSADVYTELQSPVTLAMGKDISGKPVVADLARMPHLLVAGTTGSGKSVGINAMILSMLYKAGPEQLRLILIDPKMLELSVYEGIPHLLTEVVTDMNKAANALRWCVAEMERRYKLMSKQGVRNINGFNRKIDTAKKSGQEILDPLWLDNPKTADEDAPVLDCLPLIVVVIDEFADMMMIVGKKVEELITRIAQKARAAGIHLILATQRPSVDVITGLIKANVPARVSFQVSSKVDSRTILDQGGAEQLLGHGDMLFVPPGTSMLMRIHGAYVDDSEVHRVVAAWRQKSNPNYLPEVLSGDVSGPTAGEVWVPGDKKNADNEGSDPELDDELYSQAVEFILESKRPTISFLQRRLRVGYNRAARLIEAMETAGLISSADSSGNRKILAPDRDYNMPN